MKAELSPARVLIVGADTAPGTGNISTAIAIDDTSIPVTSTADFPDGGVIQAEDEQIFYLSKDDTHFNQCIRGFRGTTAATHDGSTTAIDTPLVATDLGETHGGVTLSNTPTTVALTTDQNGSGPVSEVQTGRTVTVTANLSDITLANLAKANNATVTGTPGTQAISVGAGVGEDLFTSAKKVIIVPYVGGNPSNDVEDLIALAKAGMKSTGTINFDISNQRVIGIEFNGYPDANGNILLFGADV